MSQIAALNRKQQSWIAIGWQGISLWVPEDWYPAALGTDRASGYLRVQNAEGAGVEVKWFSPKGTVDMEQELEKYRKTMERAARKRKQTFEWKAKPRVPVREARPDKNRRFFGWTADSQALGVIWYCRTCARVVITQVTTPRSQDASSLAARILSGIEDHNEDGYDLWSLYGLQVRVPDTWHLDKHQLMAGYTMLQFRRRDRVLRTERWALANVALRSKPLLDFLWEKSYKFWKEYSLKGVEAEWRDHPGAEFTGYTRRVWRRVVGPVLRLIKRPAADHITTRAWHCDVDNKIYAVHSVHPKGDIETLENIVPTVSCH